MAQKNKNPEPERSKIIKVGTSRGSGEKELSVIARNIKKYRTECGIEQKELARRLGVIPSNVSNWELGYAKPNPDLYHAICTALGITLYELFDICLREQNQALYIRTFNRPPIFSATY